MLEIHGAYVHIVYQENAEIYIPKATHSCVISKFDSKVSQYIPTNISSLPLNGIEHNHNGYKVQELFCVITSIAPHCFDLLKGLVFV